MTANCELRIANWFSAVVLLGVVITAAAERPAKPARQAGQEVQARYAASDTQPAQSLDDQFVSYRVRLAGGEFGFDLIVVNPSGQPASVVLLARGREIRAELSPGETWSATGRGFVVSDVEFIKAARRLRMGLAWSGDAEPTLIRVDRGASVYDVFSAGREPAAHLQLRVEQYAPGRAPRRIKAGASLPAAVTAAAGETSGRGFFVAYRAK